MCGPVRVFPELTSFTPAVSLARVRHLATPTQGGASSLCRNLHRRLLAEFYLIGSPSLSQTELVMHGVVKQALQRWEPLLETFTLSKVVSYHYHHYYCGKIYIA